MFSKLSFPWIYWHLFLFFYSKEFKKAFLKKLLNFFSYGKVKDDRLFYIFFLLFVIVHICFRNLFIIFNLAELTILVQSQIYLTKLYQ